MRRNKITWLSWSDLTVDQRKGVVMIGQSKTDQESKGQPIVPPRLEGPYSVVTAGLAYLLVLWAPPTNFCASSGAPTWTTRPCNSAKNPPKMTAGASERCWCCFPFERRGHRYSIYHWQLPKGLSTAAPLFDGLSSVMSFEVSSSWTIRVNGDE